MVVDVQALRSRLRRLDRCLQVLRSVASVSAASFAADEGLRDRAERNLQVAIQACIDVATHLASGLGWGDPKSYEEALALAGARLGLPAEFVDEFRKVAGLRNLLVHDYLLIDPRRLHGLLHRLDDFEVFARAVVERFPEAKA